MTRIGLLAIGVVLLSGCAGGSHSSAGVAGGPDESPTRTAIAVRCGASPATGPTLRPPHASVIDLPGVPDGIASDGRATFVALQSGQPRIAVVEWFRSAERLVRTIAIPRSANGLRVTPDGRYVVAAAGHGAVVLDAAAAISGAGAPVLGSLDAPSATAGNGPGAAEVAISPDSRYAFVTLERAGVIAVFDLRSAISHGFARSAFVGAVPVGRGALGVATSPDGRWLYEVSESARAGSSRRLGAVNVIDLRRATRDPAHSVVATAPAPCAPVRVAASPDGTTVWVTARDANSLLGFSASALRAYPSHALRSVTRVGAQPLGVAVSHGGAAVLVADSNLSASPTGRSGMSVVNTASPAAPRLLGTIPTGKLADSVAVPPNDGPVLVTASSGRQLDAFPEHELR